MISVTFDQLQAWLSSFLWPFIRLLAFLAASPLWGHSSVPNQVKIGLAALLSILIAPTLPPLPEVPIMSWGGLTIIVEQIIIGIAMGTVMVFTYAAVQSAGHFIGLKMGLAFATFYDPASGTNMAVLARILHMITMLMLLALNGHLILLELVASSFQAVPIGLAGFNPGAFEVLARYSGTIFTTGLLLAMPLVGALTMISISLGILNRASPQLTIFAIGFPLQIFIGILLIMVMMTGDIQGFLQKVFYTAYLKLQEILGLMPPTDLS
jgi:flagellar biosynthetic protein FliR